MKVCIEGNLPIRSTPCEELTFSSTASGDTIGQYHLKSILVVPVGCLAPFGMRGVLGQCAMGGNM